MKKIVFILIVIFFLSAPKQVSYAQEEISIIPLESSSTATPFPTPVAYLLPFPGLLPDSPLYFLKTMRDRAVGFLISDPLKKTEFNLLQANKRLQAGTYLLMKKPANIPLAISTISKGQNYFEESLISFSEAKKQGLATTDMVDVLLVSSKKHKEVLHDLQKKIPASYATEFELLEKRASDIEKSVTILRNKGKKN